MKKKFKKETPVIKTVGSVGEFIEVLKNFPSDAKFELNGSADIIDAYMNGELKDITIKPFKTFDETAQDCEPFFNYPEEGCITDECEYCDADKNPVMDGYLFGFSDMCPEYLNQIRHATSDSIIESPVMMPDKEELLFEGKELIPNQVLCIDEIRQHNMYVAECLAEMYRRQISALLEYNTQCMAHFGVQTNKVMCTMVDVVCDDLM